ncbi:MAG: hypothetical protein IPJ65_15095 [Archangiaceae bacterium]|nr:hypothetical protein [Archangiaceae bacterium]
MPFAFDELSFDARAPGPLASALTDLIDGKRLGVVVRQVLDPSLLAAALARLTSGQTDFTIRPSGYFEGRVFGRLLTEEPDPELYFSDAARFDERSAAVLGPDFQRELDAAFATVAAGARVAPARDARGRSYLPLSIREMVPGGFIVPHYENEALDCPQMAELRARLTPRAQVSLYAPLQLPERGGALRLHDIGEADPRAKQYAGDDRASDEAMRQLDASARWLDVRVGVGDLLLFDASRYVHRVTRVEGARSRWTMGCFVGRDRDGALVRWT